MRFLVTRTLFVLVTVLLFSTSIGLMAQVGRSGLTGTITDRSGALVPRVKVTVKNEATNL